MSTSKGGRLCEVALVVVVLELKACFSRGIGVKEVLYDILSV